MPDDLPQTSGRLTLVEVRLLPVGDAGLQRTVVIARCECGVLARVQRSRWANGTGARCCASCARAANGVTGRERSRAVCRWLNRKGGGDG